MFLGKKGIETYLDFKIIETPNFWDQYEHVRTIAEGQFGSIWLVENCKAKHKDTKHTVLKMPMIITEPKHTDYILNEARILTFLNALYEDFIAIKGIYKIPITHDENGSEEDELVVAMELEYVCEYNLKTLVSCDGILEPRISTKVALELSKQLEKVHRHKIVHSDIKPENILIDIKEGRLIRVCLIDFGLSSMVTKRRSSRKHKRVQGSPIYLPPEIYETGNAPSSDVWALGLTFFFMITGFKLTSLPKGMPRRTPQDIIDISGYIGSKVRKITKQLTTEDGSNHPLKEIILGMLHKDVAKRLTVTEVIKKLDAKSFI